MCSRNKNTDTEEISEPLTTHKISSEGLGGHLTPITRHYVLEWSNSLSGLAQNPSEAEWKPVDGNHMELFGSTTRYAPNATKSEVKRGNLQEAILIGMKIKKIDSNFPCQLGLSVEGCKGNYYTCNGERYSYLIGSGEKSHNLESTIATMNPYVNSEYLKLYPGMTSENLRSQGIMTVPNENYVFVDKDHPIVEMMKENEDVLQIDINSADLIDSRWYKVSKVVTEKCISELESELVNHLPLINLEKFKAKIQRIYGTQWDDEMEVCDGVEREDMKNRLIESPRRCSVVLEMTYSFI
jgi:hypothetical protein